MPRIEITCQELTASKRMKIAKDVTLWFAEHGSNPSHVIVHFNKDEPMSYFSNGNPLTLYGNNEGKDLGNSISYASIVCYIHCEKNNLYMQELANKLKAILSIPDSGHCVISFVLTKPDTVFFLNSGNVISS